MNARSNRITGSLFTALLFLGAQRAAAHVEPTGCAGLFLAGPGIRVFRADGVAQIAGGDTVSPCETIEYEVTVAYPPNQGFCAFEGGRIFIVTPDGVSNDVTPASGVPCLGGDDPATGPCPLGQNSVVSIRKSYTVRPQDIAANSLLAAGYYGCGCPGANFPPGCQGPIQHDSATDTVGFLAGSNGVRIDVLPCAENPLCQRSFCDPTATDGVRTGLCVIENLGDSQTDPRCTDTDGTLCTKPGCESGQCVQAHIPPPTCPACQECKAGTGRCVPVGAPARRCRP